MWGRRGCLVPGAGGNVDLGSRWGITASSFTWTSLTKIDTFLETLFASECFWYIEPVLVAVMRQPLLSRALLIAIFQVRVLRIAGDCKFRRTLKPQASDLRLARKKLNRAGSCCGYLVNMHQRDFINLTDAKCI